MLTNLLLFTISTKLWSHNAVSTPQAWLSFFIMANICRESQIQSKQILLDQIFWIIINPKDGQVSISTVSIGMELNHFSPHSPQLQESRQSSLFMGGIIPVYKKNLSFNPTVHIFWSRYFLYPIYSTSHISMSSSVFTSWRWYPLSPVSII